MSLSKTVIILLVGVICVGAAAFAVQGGNWPDKTASQVGPTSRSAAIPVVERSFTERVVRQCHIEHGAPRLIGAPADGVLELLVADGASVAAGDAIARYETDKRDSEQRSLTADIDVLRARLAFKSGPYREKTEAIRQLEDEEQARSIGRLREKLAEMERLEAEGKIAPQRLDETRLRLEEAEAERVRSDYQRTLERAQIDLDIGQLEHDLSVARGRLDDIGREKARSIVHAPEDGQIIWRDPQLAETGSGAVRRGMPVASLVKTGLYGAVVTIGDRDMRVVEGATASVSFGNAGPPVEAEIVSKRLVDDPIEQKRGRFDYEVAIVFPGEGLEDVLYAQALCAFAKPVAAPSPAIPASAVRFSVRSRLCDETRRRRHRACRTRTGGSFRWLCPRPVGPEKR